MAKLTAEQTTFLIKHKIPLDQIFDASGMTESQYAPPMSATGKIIAIGTNPCKSGHTMRTRSGNCPQCNTAYIAFQRRHSQRGVVYIAGSRRSKLIKIGSTGNLEMREQTLNTQRYASQDDWVILAHLSCNNAGAVEIKIHELLERYRHASAYLKEGKAQTSREVFACGYPIVRFAVGQVLSPNDMKKMWEKPGADRLYSFVE